MRFRRYIGLFAAIFVLLLQIRPSQATEYDLSAYFADPQAVAAAVGSNDEKLKERLLGMNDYVADNGLEERFTDPNIWRTAVADMVSGKVVGNEFMNGFAIEMLLLAVAEPSEPRSVGFPFADLEDARNYLQASGDTELADLLHRISWGNTGETGEGLPPALEGKFGTTEYAARVSAFSVEDAKTLLGLLPQIEQANKELSAFRLGESGAGPDAARAALEIAERKRSTEFYTHETNKEYLYGRTVEQAVADKVRDTLEDPYSYADDLASLDDARTIIAAWLERTVASNRAIFFIYESS